MPGEGIEVRVEVLHIGPQVGDGLGAVHQDLGAMAVGHGGHLLYGVDGAEGIGHVREGDQASARAEQLLVLVQDHFAPAVDGGHAQLGALLCGELLPGHDVRVVLQPGDDDLIILADEAVAPALGHQVDGLRGAAHEDDVLHGGGVEEAAHLLAGALVGVRGAGGQVMGGPVDVGVLVPVEV